MKKLINPYVCFALMGISVLVSCDFHGDVPDVPGNTTTTYQVTMTNTVNYLNAYLFNTPVGTSDPGPLTQVGDMYRIQFQAVAGSRLSFATMSGVSNDWFFSPGEAGLPLFDGGMPLTGDISDQVYLWDDGTEEEDPDTVGGMDTGDPDDDPKVRIVEMDVTMYLRAYLEYEETTRMFTLTLENLRGVDVDMNPIALSPGVVVLHAQDQPLFTEGQPDPGHGLEAIARTGDPGPLYNWLAETDGDGVPMRLSSSFTVLSPGVLYAFRGRNPIIEEGAPAIPGSGIEELAEDGNAGILFDYLDGMGLYAALSDQSMPVPPGGSLTFTLEVPRGYKLGLLTMFAHSNDWLFSLNSKGLNSGQARKSYPDAFILDAGTEADEPVGLGMYQAPFQSGPDSGPEDPDDNIRRIAYIEDFQFGKGVIEPMGGLASECAQGSFNLVHVEVISQ